jgi:hypothetical protein
MKCFFKINYQCFDRKPVFGKPYKVVQPISISILSQNGEMYYGASSDFDLKKATPDIQMQVIQYLPPNRQRISINNMATEVYNFLRSLISNINDESITLYGYDSGIDIFLLNAILCQVEKQGEEEINIHHVDLQQRTMCMLSYMNDEYFISEEKFGQFLSSPAASFEEKMEAFRSHEMHPGLPEENKQYCKFFVHWIRSYYNFLTKTIKQTSAF